MQCRLSVRYQVRTVGGIIPGKKGESMQVELAMDVPFNLRRFQEMEAGKTERGLKEE